MAVHERKLTQTERRQQMIACADELGFWLSERRSTGTPWRWVLERQPDTSSDEWAEWTDPDDIEEFYLQTVELIWFRALRDVDAWLIINGEANNDAR